MKMVSSYGKKNSRLTAPQGACDTHLHFYNAKFPYESSESGPPDWADITTEARALVKAAPERMLWASNWPHPGQKNPPDEADLLDLLLDWVDDEAVRNKILTENPAELYGF
jgi:D-galactarolactone isomerase